MVENKPSVFPSGFLSLDEAIDRIDPGVLQDRGSDEERRQFDRYLEGNMASIIATHTVPEPIYVEGLRRKRRRAAFQRLVSLCAYGLVPSALLLDDFTVRAGIPTKFWLDERLSNDMCSTGRTMVQEPRSKFAVSGPSGWVIVDAEALSNSLVADATRKAPSDDGDALDAALVARPTKNSTGDDLQQPVKMLRANNKGCELIHEAIESVYSLANQQGVKPPNVLEAAAPVNAWLRKYQNSIARANLIQKMAGDARYNDHRGKKGTTVRGNLRPLTDLKI